MAIKYKLSDDEKERASKVLEAMEKDKKEVSSPSYNRRAQVSKNISLPTAKDTNNSNIPNYRQSISTKMDRLPTAKLSTNKINNMNIVDTQSIYETKDKNVLKNVVDDIKSKAKKYVNFDNKFSDGYQFGDVSKTFLGTATDITQDLASGMALKPLEGILDIGTNLIATSLNTGSGALGIKNENLAKDIRNFADKDLSSAISHRVANATPFGVAYNLANGTPRKIFNPAGIEYDVNKNPIENYKTGFKKAYLTDENEDYEKSSLSGKKADQAVEMIGYSLGNRIYGNALSSKTGTKQIGENKLSASISGGNIGIKIGKHTLNLPTLSFIGGMAGGLQEANSKENISETERWAKGISSGIIEAGSEGLFGFLGVGGNDITDNIKTEFASKFPTKVGKMLAQLGVECTGEAIEEFVSYSGNFLVDNGIIDKLGDADFSSEWDWEEVLEEMVMAYVTTGISGGGNVIINTNSSINAVEQQIGRKLTEKEKAGVTQAVIDGTLYEKMSQNQNIEQIDNTLPIANEENRYTKSQLDEMLNNKELPMQNYIYEQSGNVKVDNLRKDASKYFNNSEQTRNYISMLEKIVSDKNVEIRFDENLKTPDSKIANGSYSNGVITINPNSSRAGEFIAIHELTHAIGTNEMIDIVENYRKSNAEFDSTVKQLLQNYNTSEITEEALSDVSAQLFGNQEFINNIAQENPSIFKKIYNEIKYLWHQFRGYTTQQQFIDDLYYKWTQAYNNNTTNSKKSNYSIQTDSNGKRYVKVDTDQDIFEGIAEKDYNKIAKMYIQDYLMGETTLSNNDKAVIDGKSASKYTNPGKRQSNFNEKMQLTPELRNVLEIAQKDSISAPIKDTSKYQNWEYYKFNFELNGKNFEGTINIGIDKDGNKHFYEINKIHFTGISSVSMNSQHKVDSINNSIPSQNSDVNTTTKYSIQESENNSKIVKIKNGEAIHRDNNEKDNNIYFRFDGKDNFKGKEHKSGVSMWEDRVDDLISENIYWDQNNGEDIQRNKLLENIYDITQEEYDNMKYEKQLKLKRRIAEDKEWITNGASVFDLTEDGIQWFKDYDNSHHETDYPELNIFTGQITGQGADGENIVIPDKMLLKSDTKMLLDIINDIELDDKYINTSDEIKNREILKKIVEKINNSNAGTDTATKYSMQNSENNSWQQYLDKNFKSEGTKTNLSDIRLQTAQRNTVPSAKNNVERVSSAKNSWSEQQKVKTKQRKHYKSIIESQYTSDKAKAIAKELIGTDTYVPETNNKQLENADKRIEMSGAETELKSLMSRASTGGKITSEDIAVGERLIQYYSKIGDKQNLQEAIQATAMAGTTAGQTVQAMSLLNHQTPEGQAIWLQRSVEKMNNDLRKARGENAEQFNLTADMIDKIVDSKNKTELENNLNEVYKQLGNQVTKTTWQKIDSWRYFSMLANPRTHIRNVVGNTAMGLVQSAKNKVAGTIEGVISKINPDIERSHTIALASKEVKDFAKADIKNVADRLGMNENKYNPKTRLESSMRTFKRDFLENTLGKVFDLNNKALEAEDGFGLKHGYVKALSDYMTANNLTPDNITDKQLAKARNYAVEQAKEATFHQDSQLASLLSQLSNKNKFAKFTLDSILPFKKTPINVAKAGLEYSPVGLVKSAVYDTAQVRKGNISVNQYIDNISKGLTGTGIALVGYALASCGVLKASGSDDEDREDFEEGRGSQNYSIKIGDNTYSLDWLAPSGIPLFIGAECYEIMRSEKEKKSSSSDEESSYNQAIASATSLLDSLTNAMNPMTEMSMLSGLSSALKSYDQGSSKMLASIGTNGIKSYVNQFVPTALGQIAKTTDKYERSTTSTKTGVLPKAIDSTRNQIMNKVPGLRQLLPVKTDTWGNEMKQSDNVLLRGLENSVFPWTRKGLSSNDVDKAILDIYDNTGNVSVLPDNINKNLTINKQKYVMTSDEYSKYKKLYGETSYNLLNTLTKSKEYKKMNDGQKQFAIEKVYRYANEQIKLDYAKHNQLEYEESTLSQTVNAIKKSNGNMNNYFEFLALTQDIDKDSEKIEVLANIGFSKTTKQAIYENSVGKKDNNYSIVKEIFNLKDDGLDINDYLAYKSQEFKADKKDDGTVNGKSISGSKKEKVFNYIESIDYASYSQKLILYALEYKPDRQSDINIVLDFVRNLPNKTPKERLEIVKQFNGVKIYKDGTFDYKP